MLWKKSRALAQFELVKKPSVEAAGRVEEQASRIWAAG